MMLTNFGQKNKTFQICAYGSKILNKHTAAKKEVSRLTSFVLSSDDLYFYTHQDKNYIQIIMYRLTLQLNTDYMYRLIDYN